MGGSSGSWAVGSLMAMLDPGLRSELIRAGNRLSYPADRVLITEGNTDGYAFVLLDGTVTIFSSDDRGNQRLIGVRTAGDLVGEKGALSGKPRSATVRTGSPVRAVRFEDGALSAFVQRHPRVRDAIFDMVQERLGWANRRRIDFVVAPSWMRVAIMLSELAGRYWNGDKNNRQVEVPLRQPDIGTLAGVQSKSAQLALSKLEATGHVQRRYGRTVVTDIEALRRFVQQNDENR